MEINGYKKWIKRDLPDIFDKVKNYESIRSFIYVIVKELLPMIR